MLSDCQKPVITVISDAMVDEEEEEEDGGTTGDHDGCSSEAVLMYRIDNIAEVLEQTCHNLAVFEKLLPAATTRDTGGSIQGGNSFDIKRFI